MNTMHDGMMGIKIINNKGFRGGVAEDSILVECDAV
jgi:hypothetical protein